MGRLLQKEANFKELGTTRGYVRCNGKYTDRPGQPKRLLVYPLRHDARARLSDSAEQPEWRHRGPPAPRNPARRWPSAATARKLASRPP